MVTLYIIILILIHPSDHASLLCGKDEKERDGMGCFPTFSFFVNFLDRYLYYYAMYTGRYKVKYKVK